MKTSIFLIGLLFLIADASYSQNVLFENVPFNAATKNLVLEELARYPKGLLNQYLDSVIVCDFKFCGRSHAYPKYIELNAKCQHKRITIHHELSSVFLIRYDLKVEQDYGQKLLNEFYAINGSAYKYNIDSKPDDFEKDDPKTEYFYKRNYATTNFENDFNVIAECLWSEGKETVEFAYNNPDKPVSKKIKLVLDFYRRLDPSFTIEFFKRQNI